MNISIHLWKMNLSRLEPKFNTLQKDIWHKVIKCSDSGKAKREDLCEPFGAKLAVEYVCGMFGA